MPRAYRTVFDMVATVALHCGVASGLFAQGAPTIAPGTTKGSVIGGTNIMAYAATVQPRRAATGIATFHWTNDGASHHRLYTLVIQTPAADGDSMRLLLIGIDTAMATLRRKMTLGMGELDAPDDWHYLLGKITRIRKGGNTDYTIGSPADSISIMLDADGNLRGGLLIIGKAIVPEPSKPGKTLFEALGFEGDFRATPTRAP